MKDEYAIKRARQQNLIVYKVSFCTNLDERETCFSKVSHGLVASFETMNTLY